MKTLRYLALTTALALSGNVSAGLISDFTLNNTTNIITDASSGLEWLQWDVTRDMTVTDALSRYAADGWRLASNDLMADLFNTFGLSYGAFTWDALEETRQTYLNPSDGSVELSDDRELVFVSLFGDTHPKYDSTYCGGNNCMQYTSALFGLDNNGDGYYNRAWVYDDFYSGANWSSQRNKGQAALVDDQYASTFKEWNAGVALVRTASPGQFNLYASVSAQSQPAAVSTPSTLALFSLSIFAAAAIRSRRTKQSN